MHGYWRRAVPAALMAAALTAGPAASAEEESARPPEQEALEAIERLMNSLRLFLESIPQFEAPTMNEEGDIIIRRKRPADEPPPPPEAPPREGITRTAA